MVPKSSFAISRGFSVRHARPGADLEQAQQLMRRVLHEDFGHDLIPDWATDVTNLSEAYLTHARHALFVAVDEATSSIIGVTAVRPGGPKSPPHPAWLAARYTPEATAQLVRVWIARERRRHGVARALVAAAREWSLTEGHYQVIYLHTHADVPGAEAFWRSLPTYLIYDGRESGDPSAAIHFELGLGEDMTSGQRGTTAT